MKKFQIPESLEWDQWDVWEDTASRDFPVRYFLRWRLPQLWRRFIRVCFKDPWYYIKCRVWHRHNVLVIRTLPPTWTDRDERLLHASFQLLVDFVEKEKPFEHFNTEESHHKASYDEIRFLYDWWTVQRPRRDNPAKYGLPPTQYDSMRDMNSAMADRESEDNAMLHRLVDVRRHLWT